MATKQAFTAYLLQRQAKRKQEQRKKAEQTDKDYKAYLSMTINSYHSKRGGKYPSKVYSYL